MWHAFSTDLTDLTEIHVVRAVGRRYMQHRQNMHGRPKIFSRGGQIKGLGTKVPQRGPGMNPRWESGGFAARSRRQVVKITHK